MGEGLRLALTTFTVAPVRGPAEVDRRTAGRAMELAPLVGLVMGFLAAAVVYVFRQTSFEFYVTVLPATMGLLLLAVLSRGLHLDGLVDTADGLASYSPPEQARSVMKTPGVGALGVVTLLFVVLTQIAALSACVLAGRGTASTMLAVAVGRLVVLDACVAGRARAAESGLGALVLGTARQGVMWAWTAGLVVVFAAYEFRDDAINNRAHLMNVSRVVFGVLLALWVARRLRQHCERRFGSTNGDVLGAVLEVATLIVLVVMSLELPPSFRY